MVFTAALATIPGIVLGIGWYTEHRKLQKHKPVDTVGPVHTRPEPMVPVTTRLLEMTSRPDPLYSMGMVNVHPATNVDANGEFGTGGGTGDRFAPLQPHLRTDAPGLTELEPAYQIQYGDTRGDTLGRGVTKLEMNDYVLPQTRAGTHAHGYTGYVPQSRDGMTHAIKTYGASPVQETSRGPSIAGADPGVLSRGPQIGDAHLLRESAHVRRTGQGISHTPQETIRPSGHSGVQNSRRPGYTWAGMRSSAIPPPMAPVTSTGPRNPERPSRSRLPASRVTDVLVAGPRSDPVETTGHHRHPERPGRLGGDNNDGTAVVAGPRMEPIPGQQSYHRDHRPRGQVVGTLVPVTSTRGHVSRGRTRPRARPRLGGGTMHMARGGVVPSTRGVTRRGDGKSGIPGPRGPDSGVPDPIVRGRPSRGRNVNHGGAPRATAKSHTGGGDTGRRAAYPRSSPATEARRNMAPGRAGPNKTTRAGPRGQARGVDNVGQGHKTPGSSRRMLVGSSSNVGSRVEQVRKALPGEINNNSRATSGTRLTRTPLRTHIDLKEEDILSIPTAREVPIMAPPGMDEIKAIVESRAM